MTNGVGKASDEKNPKVTNKGAENKNNKRNRILIYYFVWHDMKERNSLFLAFKRTKKSLAKEMRKKTNFTGQILP